MTEWRPIPSYPGYEASDDGRVRSLLSGQSRELTLFKNHAGYLVVGVARGQRKVHRLVLEAFVGQCPSGMQGCHNDGDITNNHVNNLRWDTAAANHADKRAHGTQTRGDAHPSAKTPNWVAENIARMLSCGIPPLVIHRTIGASVYTCRDMSRGKTWKWLLSAVAMTFGCVAPSEYPCRSLRVQAVALNDENGAAVTEAIERWNTAAGFEVLTTCATDPDVIVSGVTPDEGAYILLVRGEPDVIQVGDNVEQLPGIMHKLGTLLGLPDDDGENSVMRFGLAPATLVLPEHGEALRAMRDLNCTVNP